MEEMLRDRLVCSINEDNIQRRMLSEKKLTYEKALELAHSTEAGMKSTKEIQGTSASQQGESNGVQPTPSEQVHKVQGGENRKGREPCYQCGGTKHVPSQYRFIEKECFNCSKLGHTARMCRSKKSNSSKMQGTQVRVVEMESPEYE